uniref:Late embryogenesis abundant protein LEA-2 subgroup domain-containing protein n=1 Tax=Davidia involucrata TaxID=16924 RepID=A0A5B6YGS2_DAVIN
MNEQRQPVLQKPPGYRDPSTPGQTHTRPPFRKPVLPQSYRPEKKRSRSCCCLCCCFICILILVLLFLIVVAGGVFYLWFEPRLPIFHLKSLEFTRFNVTVNPDGAYLNSQTVVRVEARNANSELRVIYDRTEVWLSVGNVELGSASLPGFTQEKKNITMLKFTTQAKNELVDSGGGTKLKDGFRSKSLVVSAEIQSGIGLGSGGWNTNRVGVKVLCGGVSLKQIEGGAMPKCSINFLKWININL